MVWLYEHWESQNQRILILEPPPFPELLSIQWAGKTLVPLKKNQQKQDPEKKDQVWGRKSSLLFKAPESAVGRRCSSQKTSTKGVSSCGFQGPRSVWSGSGSWLQPLFRRPLVPRTHMCPHLKGLFRFTFWICVFVHAGACPHLSVSVQMGLL